MIPAERYRELAALIERERGRRLAESADRAREAGRQALAEARSESRRRARAAFGELRGRAQGEERAARAALETARRVRRFAAESLLAEQGLARLADELRRRWRDPAARRQWIAAALAAAERLLPAGAWRVACAPGIDAAEIQSLRARGEAREEAALEAGVRIEARIATSAACVDASLAGLLRERRALQAAILAEAAAGVAT
jgi:hypothetical protein